jgi:CRISPR-associated protein Csx3
VITACPDGEGAWFQEAAERDAGDAKRLKVEYKESLNGFTPEFVKRISDSVKNCELPLTIIDIGGRTSDENREICRDATHAIILYGDSAKLPEWREFCDELGLEIIAEIFSDYKSRGDTVQGICHDSIFRGSVHYLERGEDVSQRECLLALAEILASTQNQKD